MKVAVVILNYNGKPHLERFLPSVVSFTETSALWIADNGSTDDSLIFLAEHYPQIKLIKFDKNLGFTGGYNAALKQITAEYYVLLNSDVALTANWLLPLQNALEQNPKLGACQPKILAYQQPAFFEYAGAAGGYLDTLAYPYCRGRIFDSLEKDAGQYDDRVEIHWATGACMAVRADLFHDLGGLDERFFAHMEEIDLCWRLKSAGYSIQCIPESVVYHLGGGTLHKSNPRKTYLNFRNSLMTMAKNLPRKKVLPKIFLRLILDGVAGIKFLAAGEFKDFMAIIRAHFAFYKLLNVLLKENIGNRSDHFLIPKSVVWAHFVKKIKTYSEFHA